MICKVIATGSTGNAVLLENSILIDCGVPYSKLEPYVKDIKLVLLTHIHSDHFNPRTIKALHDHRPSVRFACCEWMVEPLVMAGVDKRQIDVIPLKSCYEYRFPLHFTNFIHVTISPEETHHDVQNCCWHIHVGPEVHKREYFICESAFYATDCGTLDGIEAKGYDLYLVEANHREQDIQEAIKRKEEAGEFCYEKRAAKVHLSEEKAIAWLEENMGENSQYIFLHGHVEKYKEEAE